MKGTKFVLLMLIAAIGVSSRARSQAQESLANLPASRLIDVVVDKDQAYRMRREALQFACARDDAPTASLLLDTMRSWANQLSEPDSANPDQAEVASSGPRFGLISIFVHDCVGSLELSDPADKLAFLQTVAMGSRFSPNTKHDCYRQIAASAAPIPLRRECALQLIERMPHRLDPPRALVPLLDNSSFPRLRELMRSSADPDNFHFAAAGALSFLGDQQIAPDLKALKPAFRAKHRNFEGHLMRYLWRIEIQHPPTKLIDYISSTEIGCERRPWAVRRAVELGVPAARIRQAILAHAREVKPTGEFGIRPGLATLKKVALEFRVLHPEDLPDVQVPETGSIP